VRATRCESLGVITIAEQTVSYRRKSAGHRRRDRTPDDVLPPNGIPRVAGCCTRGAAGPPCLTVKVEAERRKDGRCSDIAARRLPHPSVPPHFNAISRALGLLYPSEPASPHPCGAVTRLDVRPLTFVSDGESKRTGPLPPNARAEEAAGRASGTLRNARRIAWSTLPPISAKFEIILYRMRIPISSSVFTCAAVVHHGRSRDSDTGSSCCPVATMQATSPVVVSAVRFSTSFFYPCTASDYENLSHSLAAHVLRLPDGQQQHD